MEARIISVAFEHYIGPTTVDEWLAQEHPTDGSRIELAWGYLRRSPPPTGQHQRATFVLARVIEDALREGGRTDLHIAVGVGVKISTPCRTALIPDVVVLNTKSVGAWFQKETIVLVAEVWSPSNTPGERDTKAAAYASADVPYFWEVDTDRAILATRVLEDGQYVEDLTVRAGTTVTINAAPVPVTFDPVVLRP